MALFRFTRCFTGPTRVAPRRLNTNLGRRSKSHHSCSEEILSSSNAIEVRKQRTAEAALFTFYSHLNNTINSTQQEAFAKVHAAAYTAMQRCLQSDKTREALAVYHALCSCGLMAHAFLPIQANEPVDQTCLERMALEALRRIPHHARERAVVSRLAVAEAGERLGQEYEQIRLRKSSSRRASPPSLAEVAARFNFSSDNGYEQKVSEAERFRIDLHRGIQLLCTSNYAQFPIGRNYLLKKLYDITISDHLQADIEVQPMCLLSAGVLWHPFAYTTPTQTWARQLSHFDDIAVSPASNKNLSEAQMEGLQGLWESTATLRPLCRSALFFLTSVFPDWDQVFLKRVSETLILPEQAHNIFPDSYNRLQSVSKAVTGGYQTELGKVRTKQAQQPHSLTQWTDPRHELFTSIAVSSTQDALRRTELILRRRLHCNIVVPDMPYILRYFNQLEQIGRHREVVLTHGVLLDLLHVALDPRDPRRFNARRTLRAFMLATTTSLTRNGFTRSQHSYPMSSASTIQGGGVTVLGVQDELVLLDACPERAYVTDPELAEGAFNTLSYLQALPRAGQETKCLGHVSAVLVSKQLERLVKIHSQGGNFLTVLSSKSELEKMDIEQLIDSIFDKPFSQACEAEELSEPSRLQLFTNEPRSTWSHNSVVVATTSANTRSLAYTLGVHTFPPTSVS